MFFHRPYPAACKPDPIRNRKSYGFRPLSPVLTLLLGLFLTQAPSLAPAQQYRKALFPHRSVGLCFWDRSQVSNQTPPTTIALEISKYNLLNTYTGSDAVSMVPVDREPGGQTLVNDQGNGWNDWVNVFSGADAWSSAFYTLMDQYPIIIVKTGYPATQYMASPDSITAYQNDWRIIIGYMRSRPQNFFVITTNYPAATDGHATRDEYSNEFCLWAKTVLAKGNDKFGPFPANVYVLDWFHMLASAVDGYCDPMYGSAGDSDQAHSPGGDHPSNLAVALIDPLFVNQIYNAAIAYEGRPLAATWAGPPTLTVNPTNRVQVAWQTLSEINTYRFYVQRQGRQWVTIDSVNAGGTSLSSRHYAVTDLGVTAGTWVYRIKEVDLDGSINYSPTVSTTLPAVGANPAVTAYALDQNYPNPFNPVTTIQYALPNAANVKLTVFNMLGQETATLVNDNKPAGVHTVQFDGSRLASGLYFYRLQAGTYVQMKKLVLLK
jgi:hypothetical protein